MKHRVPGAAAAAAFLLAGTAQAQTSVYTPMEGAACRSRALIPDDPVDGGGRRCPGAGGYALKIETGDDRDFVSVVDPRGREHDLRLSEVVTWSFSWVGPRAEWRLAGRGARPHALIFRLNHQRETNDGNASPLVVARLDRMCVTAVVPAGRRQNEAARGAADRPGPCLPARTG